jgi:hypothetical protein
MKILAKNRRFSSALFFITHHYYTYEPVDKTIIYIKVF